MISDTPNVLDTSVSSSTRLKATDNALISTKLTHLYSMCEQRKIYEILSRQFKNRDNWYRELHPGIRHVLEVEKAVVQEQIWYDYSGGWTTTPIGVNLWQARNITRLALEQPSLPDDGDEQRVAYWQSSQKQARGVRTVTSLGKYLRRHFSMPDHEIRDVVALHAAVKYEFITDTDEIVEVIQEGPYSCMQRSYSGSHPYEVYTEEFGWKLCVGYKDGEIHSRALVNGKNFIRTYGWNYSVETKSTDSPEMTQWLISKGYKLLHSWPSGTRIAKVTTYPDVKTHYVFPYLDGNNNYVDECSGCFEILSSGEYRCDQVDGTANEEGVERCDSCGDRTDNSTYIEGEGCICEYCLDRDYVHAFGSGGRQEWVKHNVCTEVDGDWYVDADFSDNDIVTLHDGTAVKMDQAVYVESEYEYYPADEVGDNPKSHDWTVCRLSDGDYELRENCEYCEHNEDWIKKEDAVEVEFHGKCYVVERGFEEDFRDYMESITPQLELEIFDEVEV